MNIKNSINLLCLSLFYFHFGYSQKNHEEFSQKYSGMGAISEIIMSHKCVIRNNFNLFYESSIKSSESDGSFVWYKLVFHQPCYISFTIIPNDDRDKYELDVYKAYNTINICDGNIANTFTKVDSLNINVLYHDNFQSQTFRGSLFNTKKITVKANETLYILVNHIEGPDVGHVIDLQSCDYSYIFKTTKGHNELDTLRPHITTILQKFNSIAGKICNKGAGYKLGYSNFLGTVMSTANYSIGSLDSVSLLHSQKVRRFDSLAGKLTFSTNNFSDTINITTYKKGDVLKVRNKYEFLFDFKVANKDSTLKDTLKSIKEIANGLTLLKDTFFINYKNAGYQAYKKAKKKLTTSFVKNSNIVVVNSSSREIIKDPELKFYRVNLKKYYKADLVDTLGVYHLKKADLRRMCIKCNKIGFKDFLGKMDFNSCFNKGDTFYYFIFLDPILPGDVFVLNDVLFYPNSACLKSAAFKELDRLAYYLEKVRYNLKIKGHTQGNHRINNVGAAIPMEMQFRGSARKLSFRRASVVLNYLTKKGIDRSRLIAKGYAGRKAKVKHPANDEERQLNIRVEFEILNEN